MATLKLRRQIGIRRAILAERSATEPPSLLCECLRQLGFFAVPKIAEKVWSGGDWSRERNRDPTFSGTELRTGLTGAPAESRPSPGAIVRPRPVYRSQQAPAT